MTYVKPRKYRPLPITTPPEASRPSLAAREHAEARRGRRWTPWVVSAGVLGATIAALAVARTLGRDTPPVVRSLRSRPRTFDWREHGVVYYQSGPAGAPPVVLVHSIHAAASAWEWRGLFGELAGDHRVYAYDLLGFGASERPEVEYDADLYVELLRDFLAEVVEGPAHVVAASLSGAHALVLAAEAPELFASLTVVNPTGLVTQAGGQGWGGLALETLVRTPFVGEALFNLLVSRPSLRFFASRLYRGDNDRLVDATVDHGYVTAHQENARFAAAAFLGQHLAANVEEALAALTVPTLALWTDEGGAGPTDAERDAFAEAGGAALRHVFLAGLGALPHEEAPDEVATVVRREVLHLSP
ncbi:MAG: alpha/beta fold hydrolase [Thermoanaerobaculia bacterium]|nr:alpha/beta fold hydrolase [Thermoanaerobaculia bacterium]